MFCLNIKIFDLIIKILSIIRSNSKCINIFCNYLLENNKICCMFDFFVILNEMLVYFYVDLRKFEGGCRYKVILFEFFYNGFNNCLKFFFFFIIGIFYCERLNVV